MKAVWLNPGRRSTRVLIAAAAAVLLVRSGGEDAAATQRPGLGQAATLRPGMYVIRPLNNPRNCVSSAVAVDPWGHLQTWECVNVDSWPEGSRLTTVHAVVPGHYAYRVQSHHPNKPPLCATVARGVVLGPARIDLARCDMPRGATSRCSVGEADQRFWFRRVGRRTYEVRASVDENECWSVKGNSLGREADIVKWACHEGPDQRFEFEYAGPLTGENRQCALDAGWVEGPDGLHKPVISRATNLPGSDIRPLVAASDAACARACTEEAQCRAFTWVRPGVQGAEGRCWLKNAIPAPRRDPNTVSGVVRPAD